MLQYTFNKNYKVKIKKKIKLYENKIFTSTNESTRF